MNNDTTSDGSKLTPHKKPENPWLNIGLNIIIPSVIMMKFSDEATLGPVWGLIIALLFPISYGVYDYFTRHKTNFFSIIGLISVLMTGGIGLLKLSREWMIVKETAIPALFGIAVVISGLLNRPLVKIFFQQIMLIDKINHAFEENGHKGLFGYQLQITNYYLAGTFFISAVLNYILAEKILVGDPGTAEFNESLGRMTFLSFPVITLPMMIMMFAIIIFLAKSIKKHTGLSLEDVVITPDKVK